MQSKHAASTLIAAAFLLLTSQAQAAGPPMPSYDVATFCSGNVREKSCIQEQYLARLSTSSHWAAATATVRQECIAAAGRYNDYSTLGMCIMSHMHDSEVQ